MDQFPASLAVDLSSQVVDVDVYDFGKGVEFVVLAVLGDHGPGHYLVRVAHEVLKKPVFLAGEFDSLILTPHVGE